MNVANKRLVAESLLLLLGDYMVFTNMIRTNSASLGEACSEADRLSIYE